MFNYFHYRGVCSLDLGVLVSDAEPWTTKVTPETVTIPGRGDALLGYEYSNSDAVYNIIIRKTGRDTLTDAVERVRRWLLPDVDYSPLRDSYNPGYYRRAYLPGGLAVTRDGLHEAVATVTFSAMPFNPVVFLPTPHGLLPMKCTPEQYEQFQRDGNKLKIKSIDHGER